MKFKYLIQMLFMLIASHASAECIADNLVSESSIVKCDDGFSDAGFIVYISKGTENENCSILLDKGSDSFVVSKIAITDISGSISKHLPDSVNNFFGQYPELKITPTKMVNSSSQEVYTYSLTITLQSSNDDKISNGSISVSNAAQNTSLNRPVYCKFDGQRLKGMTNP